MPERGVPLGVWNRRVLSLLAFLPHDSGNVRFWRLAGNNIANSPDPLWTLSGVAGRFGIDTAEPLQGSGPSSMRVWSHFGGTFCCNAATYHRFEVARQNEPLPESGAELGQAGGSMFLLIFDECAYPRVFPQDALREDMPNFRAFGACATIYRRCYSEGSETPLSIPRLLLKDDSPLRATDARRLMRDVSGGKLKPGASLFTDATNFFRAVTGLHLDYEQLVGDDVEYVSTSIFRSRMPFFEKVMRVWLDAFPFWAA